MQYFVSYYWQSASENGASLVLQHAYCKRRRVPILLACICEGRGQVRENGNEEGKILTRNLADWFYDSGLQLCAKNGEKGIQNFFGSMERFLEKYSSGNRKQEEGSFAGILCVGQEFLLFQRGRQRASLLNTRNNRPNCHEIDVAQQSAGRVCSRMGTIQKGVGILLATDGLRTKISGSMTEECLDVRELVSQERTEGRLQELGKFAEKQGGTDIGAVLIVAQ